MKQYTYWRNATNSTYQHGMKHGTQQDHNAATKGEPWNNCPMLIVYAGSVTEADKQFQAITGTHPQKLPHIGLRIGK